MLSGEKRKTKQEFQVNCDVASAGQSSSCIFMSTNHLSFSV